MQVSDRCHLSPEQLRALARRGRVGKRRRGPSRSVVPAAPKPKAPAGAPPRAGGSATGRPPPREGGGPSRYRPFQLRLLPGRRSTPNLASAMTLHEAIESAAPEVADLLGQLAVEDTSGGPRRRPCVDWSTRLRPVPCAELRREARSSIPVAEPRRTSARRSSGPALRPRSHALGRARPGLRNAPGRCGAALASFVAGKS